MSSDVVIYGAGYVGTAMSKIFPDAVMVDPLKGLKPEIPDAARLAIICVPTPMQDDGSCDVSAVFDCVNSIPKHISFILIKSTVQPGTTSFLSALTQRAILFSPEYVGEGEYYVPPQFPDPHNPISHGFMVLGGDPMDCEAVAGMFVRRMGPTTRFRFMSSIEAELVKYFENAFLALKVTFTYEMRRICRNLAANYFLVREGWLDDPRVGLSHSVAFENKTGFDGKCLPKDINALAFFCRQRGFPSKLLEAIIDINDKR
jgi:UDPglucose 6-dehydrogenase